MRQLLASLRAVLRVRVWLSRGYWNEAAWVFHVAFGRGAGYRWGATAYVGRSCHDGRNRGALRAWRAGLTRNGNAVPYPL